MSKPREFVVYEVLPEQISGGKPWLGATEGDRFVEQDSWIGFQVHVIEYSAYEKLKAQLAVAVEALQWADEFFTARDEMNAKVHCAPIRLSPITERVKQAIEADKVEGK